MKKKPSGSGIIVIIFLFLLYKYWEFTVGITFLFLIGYALTRSGKKDQKMALNDNSRNNYSGLTLRIEVGNMNLTNSTDDKDQVFSEKSDNILTIGDYKVPLYLLYTGTSRYPHVINPNLETKYANGNYEAQMGYWPSYSQISSSDRATYLYWLSTGRSAPQANIGLVFLYFYGLEYRAISEKKNHTEILSELMRLFNIYGRLNGSFSKYCSGLICWIVNENTSLQKNTIDELVDFLKQNYLYGQLFKDIAGRLGSEAGAEKLLKCCALSLTSRQTFPRSLVIFKPSISRTIERKFSDINLDSSLIKFGASSDSYYRTATALRLDARTQSIKVTASKKLVEQIEKIYKDTIYEYSLYESHKEDGSPLLGIFKPKEISSAPNDLLVSDDINSFVQSFDDYKICELSELLSLIVKKDISTINLPTSRRLTQYLRESFNLQIEPDAQITSKAYKMQDKVLLFKNNLTEPDEDRWLKSTRILDLAIAFLKSDKSFENKDTKPVIDFIEAAFKMEPDECKRLEYRALLLEDSKQSISTTAKRINTSLNIKQKEALARFLFSLASQDGVIDNAELKALEKTFTALNLNQKMEKLIKEYESKENPLVMLKTSGRSTKKGSSIPRKVENTPTSVSLNESALEAAFKEASDVSRVLASVFVEDEPLPTKVPTVTAGGLSDVDRNILSQIITKEKWLIQDVEKICKSSKVMYGAFFTKINRHFDDLAGIEVLSEEDDELCVDLTTISREVQIA